MIRPPSQVSADLRSCSHYPDVDSDDAILMQEAADLIDSLDIDNHRSALYFAHLMLALKDIQIVARDLVDGVQPHPHDPERRAVVWLDNVEKLIEFLARKDPELATVEQMKVVRARVWTEASLTEPVTPTPITP